MKLGVRINQYLGSKGTKQSFVADKAKINPKIFSRIMRGERPIRADEYMSICKALGVPVNTFIEEDWLNVS